MLVWFRLHYEDLNSGRLRVPVVYADLFVVLCRTISRFSFVEYTKLSISLFGLVFKFYNHGNTKLELNFPSI